MPMNPRLKASPAAIELIKRFEGFRPAAAQLPDGRWAIGHGHIKTARQGVTITEADAEALLLYDLIQVQDAINDAVFTPLSQNQFDALTAFAFNVGLDNFHRSSVLRRINEGNLVQAACAIEMWRKADLDGERIVVDALVRRRSAEKTLFLTPVDGWSPAPSAVVRPRVDYDVAGALPRTSTEAAVVDAAGRLTARPADRASAQDALAVADQDEVVTARLKSLNLAEADAGIDLAPAPAPEPEDEPGPAAPESVSSPAADPAESPSPTAFDASRRIVRREASTGIREDRADDDVARIGGVPLLGIGLSGLALFGGSVFWAVNSGKTGGVLDAMVVASILGLVGIALVAGAVYFLLVKLGGRGE